METHQLESKLRSLRLSGMLATLEARLAQARGGELGHLEFLEVLLEDEISRREAKALGHLACRRGYSVLFAQTSRLLAELAGGRAGRRGARAPGRRASCPPPRA